MPQLYEKDLSMKLCNTMTQLKLRMVLF